MSGTGWELDFVPLARGVRMWVIIAVGVLLAAWTLRLYVVNLRGKSSAARWTLPLLRVAAMSCILVLLFRPVIRFHREVVEPRRVVVLADASRSMAIGKEGRARIDEVRNLLEALGRRGWKHLRMETYAFGTSIRRVGDLKAVDGRTNLRAALEFGGKRRPRAVVLATDGCWNDGGAPLPAVESIAASGVPVHVLSMERFALPVDAALKDVSYPETVMLGDFFTVSATVETRGMKGADVRVELKENGRTSKERTFRVGAPTDVRRVSFVLRPRRAGVHEYELTIPAVEGEASTANNSRRFRVEVKKRRISVLVVESEPRWEFRYLKNALMRDPEAAFTGLLLRPGVGPADGKEFVPSFPRTRNERESFDMVVLGDVDPTVALGEKGMRVLKEFVTERGGGLLVMPGRRYGLGVYRGTPLEKILPVRTPPAGAPPGLFSEKPFRPALTPDGRKDPLMAVPTPEAWKRLPGMLWCAYNGGVVPTARVLLEHPWADAGGGALPLLAVRRVGRGRVVFLGIDGLWRWRLGVGDEYFYRFWAQFVRWLQKRPFEGGDPFVKLRTDKLVYRLGEEVYVEARILGRNYFPLSGAEVFLVVDDDKGRHLQLRMREEAPGWGIFGCTFKPSRRGAYELRVYVPSLRSTPSRSMVRVDVEDSAYEVGDVSPDVSFLRAVADKTGGVYGSSSEILEALERLDGAPPERRIVNEYNLWDTWYTLLVITTLLCTEWLLRKRWNLV